VVAPDTAAAPRTTPPTPEECDHPAPVLGIMAHEFAPYDGALGPEGLRRTTMYYGPVVGGLPIEAWHCEVCGLLRLSYPDGRKEERRLFPGPQPGLIAVPTTRMPEVQTFGMQARVSGLSLDPRLVGTLIPAEAHGPLFTVSLPQVTLPQLDLLSWLTAILLGLACIGGLYVGVLAVYTYRTPSAVWPAVIVTLTLFGSAILLQIGAAAMRHFFPMPPLAPSPAEQHGGKAELDPATRTAVFLMVLATLGLFIGGVLAVYDWRTPDAVFPLFLGVLVCFALALLVKVADAARRHLGGR
jgi:hypothetical protein